MAKKSVHSIEEQIEDWCKSQLGTGNYYTKTQSINSEISNALKKAPSKKGGDGRNFPDIQCFIESPQLEHIPVMIEVKGTQGDFIKDDADGNILNTNSKGEPNYTNIAKYAVNGAVHYAQAILDYAPSYNAVLAVGVNGFPNPDGTITYQVGVYWVSKHNLYVPKKVGIYSDLSILKPEHIDSLFSAIRDLQLTPHELEEQKLKLEDQIERNLKNMNQRMRDELKILDIDARVRLIAGMVMAGLGVKDEVSPLSLEELKGELGERTNDGVKFMNKILDFLAARKLPNEKIRMVENELNKAFLFSKLQVPTNGISILHNLYADVKDNLLKFLTGELHNIDFTGKLFNSITEWIRTPEDPDNDVVLTPRQVTELMAKICGVNKKSYVWDFATGSGGFLISAMHLMLQDARETCTSPEELAQTEKDIKFKQLLGIEKLPSIYLLAVLNMILMKDGSSNLIHADSLEFEGNYEQGEDKGKEFPANVFLLNPPYSAEGKGFIFVRKALSMMHHGGMAAVLIQENAGSGNGLPYTKQILENNTLVASIHMSDIFCGKASVQTAIYVFKVGVPHSPQSVVKFIDFSNDGYARQNRKKSSQSVNLRDTDHAKERYAEVVTLVKYGRGVSDANLHYFTNSYIEDYITLDGNDWTYQQHIKIDTTPSIDDFQSVIKDYLAWRVGQVLKHSEDGLGKQ